MLLLMVQESGEHQLRLVVYPSDYKGNFWFPSTSKLFENQDRSSTQILFEISLQIPHTKKKIHLVWCKHVFMLGITYILNNICGSVCFVSRVFFFSPTGNLNLGTQKNWQPHVPGAPASATSGASQRPRVSLKGVDVTKPPWSGRNQGNPIWPIGSMYGIFTYICLIFMVNVGKYTIHGSSGW